MPLTLTRSEDRKGVAGNLRYESLFVAFDASYPTGGESLTPANVGMDVFYLVLCEQKSGFAFEFNYTGNLLLVYRVGAEATHQHNITTVAAAGAGTAMLTPMVAGALEGGAQTNTNAVDAGGAVAAAALAQVADTTDLSALTSVRVFVLGK